MDNIEISTMSNHPDLFTYNSDPYCTYRLSTDKDVDVVSEIIMGNNVKFTQGHHIHYIDDENINRIKYFELKSAEEIGPNVFRVISIIPAGTQFDKVWGNLFYLEGEIVK